MITDYIKLDAERFVKDYYFYREQIPRSQKELDDMDGLSAIRYDRQPGNKTFDDSGIDAILVARDRLANYIDRMNKHVMMFEKIRATMTDDEKKILDLFYAGAFSLPKIEMAGYSRSHAYRLRAKALRRVESAFLDGVK